MEGSQAQSLAAQVRWRPRQIESQDGQPPPLAHLPGGGAREVPEWKTHIRGAMVHWSRGGGQRSVSAGPPSREGPPSAPESHMAKDSLGLAFSSL